MDYFVVAVGLAAMSCMTVSDLRVSWRGWILTCLWCCLGYFSVELVVKSWPTSSIKRAQAYLLSAESIIDALAVLPIPIALLIGIPPDKAWLFASLWLLKLAERAPGLLLLWRVVVLEAAPLAGVFLVFLIVLLFASVTLYLLEGTHQAERFGNLPLSLWWAVTTLTTTGYGDTVPQTFLGRLVAGIVMICGIGVIGLWTGILIAGFTAELRRRDFIRNWDLVTRVPFLRDLDAPAIIELTRMLRPVDLAERTIVVRRGRPADCMYFIASGEVEVKLEPQPVRLGPGSFFGEIALLEGGPRRATVVTVASSTLLILEAADFRAFMALHPEVARAVETEAKRRIESLV